MKLYTIVCNSGRPSSWQLGWDWGSEIHYDRESAQTRAEELEQTVSDGTKFKVVPASITVKGLRK